MFSTASEGARRSPCGLSSRSGCCEEGTPFSPSLHIGKRRGSRYCNFFACFAITTTRLQRNINFPPGSQGYACGASAPFRCDAQGTWHIRALLRESAVQLVLLPGSSNCTVKEILLRWAPVREDSKVRWRSCAIIYM